MENSFRWRSLEGGRRRSLAERFSVQQSPRENIPASHCCLTCWFFAVSGSDSEQTLILPSKKPQVRPIFISAKFDSTRDGDFRRELPLQAKPKMEGNLSKLIA
jgi:hypothetical protein